MKTCQVQAFLLSKPILRNTPCPRFTRRIFSSLVPDPIPVPGPPSSESSDSKKYHPSPPPLDEPSTFPPWAFEPRDFFRYELIYQSKISNARVGRIHTPHGIIDTPGFVAVATNGALKGVDFRQADEAGQQLVFCNSYHLMLQPGPEIIAGTLYFICNYCIALYCVVLNVFCLSLFCTNELILIELNQRMDTLGSHTIAGSSLNSVR